MGQEGHDILIVGGGIVGTAAAEWLSAKGKRIILLDGGDELPASERSMGWVNDAAPSPAAYHRLRRLGQTALIQEQEWSRVQWYHSSGTLTWEESGVHQLLNTATVTAPESIIEAAGRLVKEGQNARVVTARDAAGLEPGLEPSGVNGPVLWTEADGWVDLPLLVEQLRERAVYRGVEIKRRKVVALLREGDKIVGVRTGDGNHIYAKETLIAAGAGSAHLMRSVGSVLPDESTTGVLIHTAPISTRLRTVMRTPGAEIRSDDAGRLVIVSPQLDQAADESSEALEQKAEEILEYLSRFLQHHPRLRIETIHTGRRPIPGGKLPIAGRVPGFQGLSIAFTHSGATVGFLLGRLLAEEMVNRLPSPLLVDFRPERFV